MAKSIELSKKCQQRKNKTDLKSTSKKGTNIERSIEETYVITELNSGKVKSVPPNAPKTPEVTFRRKYSKTYDRRRVRKTSKILEYKNKFHEKQKMNASMFLVDCLINDHTRCLLDLMLSDVPEDQDDILLWDPHMIPEKEVVAYLKEWPRKGGEEQYINPINYLNSRQPDNESAISSLVEVEYDTDKALKAQQLGKYSIIVEEAAENHKSEDSNKACDSGFSDPSLSTQSQIDFEISTENKEVSHVRFQKEQSWSGKMKLNFEKGMILFGENVDEIREHYRCFSHLKPLNLDLYFYSNERQKFIGTQDVSKKIVDILDQTSLKHLQEIEFFELGRDWAQMRQNAQGGSSESDESVYVESRYNSFGRTIKSLHKKKRRPRRLPNRFSHFHM